MKRKALFFDIDGTLFSEIDRQVPQSAVLALKKARENGHLVFINTGRTHCQTASIQKEVEVDGLLCGCGTYIVVGDSVLYDREIPLQEEEAIKSSFRRFKVEGILEGRKGCYMKKAVSRFAAVEDFRKSLTKAGMLFDTDLEEPGCRFSKFCVLTDGESDVDGFIKSVKDFQVIDRGRGFYECVPLGHSKATAIEVILDRYRIAKADTWVFGDSTNDLSMFQYADNAVLMGKHDAALKPYATFVTKTVEEDGIAYALAKLEFI